MLPQLCGRLYSIWLPPLMVTPTKFFHAKLILVVNSCLLKSQKHLQQLRHLHILCCRCLQTEEIKDEQ